MLCKRKIKRKATKGPIKTLNYSRLDHASQIVLWEIFYKEQLGWSKYKIFHKVINYRSKHPKLYSRITYLIRWGKIVELYSWFWKISAHKYIRKTNV